ncbi:MAG: hypothetical protein KJ950_13145 [Proteobacteria bacterium]|nr:hypothetical protein [Pseudomonadota bacterium]MBU1688424.1 hypothetical protein [Pseudomonadota bacterium]
MTNDKCLNVTHNARNGVQALMGQMIVLRSQLSNMGLLDQVDLSGLDLQIERIGHAIDQCRPSFNDLTNNRQA